LVRLGRLRWVHFLPILHLCACFASFIGLVVPSLQYWGIVFTFILVLDLPISLVAYGLGWKHGAVAIIWIAVVGTLWWYLLSRGAEVVFNGIAHRQKSAPLLFPDSLKRINDRDES
jgi:hypothetical protein